MANQKALGKRSGMARQILLACLLLFLALILLGTAYILSLDAWNAFDPAKLRDVPQSLIVYDADGQEISSLHAKEDRIYVTIDEIPQLVQKAFISAEDIRFYEHNGIDVRRILAAAWADIKAGAYVQGASTISQQLIKLSHLTSQKNLSRKIEEAILAYQMEKQFSKDEILEMYLNYVYFGGGYYGIEAAARGYFGVHANELSIAQGAQLAGILKSPTNYAPHLNPESSVKRRNQILESMKGYGFLNETECAAAKAEPAVIVRDDNLGKRGYYVDLALQEACGILEVDMEKLLSGGYRIRTAMNSSLQSQCEQWMQDETLFPSDAASGLEAALVVIDVETSGVAALMGGRESTAALAYNRAVSIRRQPGSVIKPIISYAPALEYKGYTAVSMLLDERTNFNGYAPENFGGSYYGWVTLRTAVAKSLNVPAVKVLSDIGVKTGKDFASSVGIVFDESDNSLALALGGFTYGVSPYQIAGAYAAFAAGGVYSTPALIMEITNAKGETLYRYAPEKRHVMSEANAYVLTSMLQSVVEEGTGRRLNLGDVEIAGKTGTVGNVGGRGNRDAWMAAYNPQYAAAVWMGYDDSTDGKELPANMTGGTYPALLLEKVFSALYQDRAAPAFIIPEGVKEYRLDKYTLENEHTAVLANALTPSDSMLREVFVDGTEPVDISEYWIVPTPPNKLSFTTALSGWPEISFEPVNTFVLYRLYRIDGQGNTELLGEWPGSHGTVRYTDIAARNGESYEYYVLPVHPQLEIAGRQVIGPASRRLKINMPDDMPEPKQNAIRISSYVPIR